MHFSQFSGSHLPALALKGVSPGPALPGGDPAQVTDVGLPGVHRECPVSPRRPVPLQVKIVGEVFLFAIRVTFSNVLIVYSE